MATAPLPLGPLDRPRAVPDTEIAVFEGEAVVFHEPTLTVHRLGAVAGAVWMSCDGTLTVADIVDELAEAFGTDAHAMGTMVAEALAQLASEGLLVGTTGPQRVLLARDDARTSDGAAILAPPATSADERAEAPVGAIALRLRVGDPVVVIIGFLEEDGLALGRELFADWIDPDVDVSSHRPSFVVATGAGTGRVRPVPQVRFGSIQIARCASALDAFLALAGILGGIETPPRAAGVAQVALRLFVAGDRAVLAHIDRPDLVNDRTLAAAGIHEWPVWTVGIDSTGRVRVPPALPQVRWPDGTVPPPPTELRLAGVVACGDDTVAEVAGELVALSGSSAWLQVLDTLAADQRVTVVRPKPALRVAIELLLDRR